MPPDDKARLFHMLQAAEQAIGATEHRGREALNQDEVWTLGLVKCIEVVGEAASRLSEELKTVYPEVPWRDIVAMRNRLIHVYFEIDLEQVWSAVTVDLPRLRDDVRRILSEQYGESVDNDPRT